MHGSPNAATPPDAGDTSVQALTETTFDTIIAPGSGIALVDFGAEWCPPCRMMAPVIERIARNYAGRAIVATVDVDANPGIAARYLVRSLPTFLFFENGELIAWIVGAVPEKMLAERLDALGAASHQAPPAP